MPAVADAAESCRENAVIRVLVAEDTGILRDTLVAVLNLQDDLEVVAEVPTGDGIVPAAMRWRPDVAVLDIDLPHVDGITAASALYDNLPSCRVLILTGLARPANLRRALTAHVAGFLIKDAPAATLIDAIRRIAAGERVIDTDLAVATVQTPENPLTRRETEVLQRYAAGADPKQIAAELFLSYGTVRNYLASAMIKLDARNRVDALRIAAEAGWL
jgi:two-component system response regulator DesR